MHRINRLARTILASLLIVAATPYVSGIALGQAGKVPVSLQDFENQGSGAARWDFLKKVEGPSSDPISNGLMERLTSALEKTETLTVAKTFRGPKVPGFPPDPTAAPGTPMTLEAPRFIVSCSATMNGDIVTIEVRLVDPHTKKLIKATTVEGRPEDLQQEISGLLGARQGIHPVGHESVAEQTLRTAITKAATWIGVNTLESVMVKAGATKVKEGPSLQSATLATVRQGTVLKKVGQEGEWIRVRLDNGEMGWVYRELVE
jgi:curli biogenesis system outer membrane secretion channel CsgG